MPQVSFGTPAVELWKAKAGKSSKLERRVVYHLYVWFGSEKIQWRVALLLDFKQYILFMAVVCLVLPLDLAVLTGLLQRFLFIRQSQHLFNFKS
jgi:hypothetical protein